MKFKHIVLFDMDGTLTPARRPLDSRMLFTLADLAQHAQVGVVSGSGFNYIDEQMKASLWGKNGTPILLNLLENVMFFPCNGTQVFRWAKDHFVQVFGVEMKPEMGMKKYRRLIRSVLQLQCELIDSVPDMPVTGHFVSDRGSMVNWCPIGREAGPQERGRFVELDEEYGIRVKFRRRLRELLHSVYDVTNLEIALGGQTSFDIYPQGWDKTYALRHIGNDRTVWFVGDKCGDGGNDQAIYESIKSEDPRRAFWVSSPEEAARAIENIIAHIRAS